MTPNSESIVFDQPTLPVLAACDAVVIGGSFGGIAAALALARAGRSVTLVEPRTYVGREITAALRAWLTPPESPPNLIASMIAAAGKARGDVSHGEIALNMDALKIHLEDRLLDAGVRLIYASLLVGVDAPDGQLRGVVIGNKSGRQALQCRLLIDTSETALAARLLNEAFDPPPAGDLLYRRTLEYDNVASSVELDKPITLGGITARLHAGYRGRGHVLVECDLHLPLHHADAPADAPADAFDLSARESAARQQTMAFAAALAANVPAFESAYLSGASYELSGAHVPRLSPRTNGAFGSQALAAAGASIPLEWCAGSAAGVWYLNHAVSDHQWDDPVFASAVGAALGQFLAAQPHSVSQNADSSGRGETRLARAEPSAAAAPHLRVREPQSPQRGRPYPRINVDSAPLPVLREVDVLVVGGGSSGATAAITAGREGVQTVLVEMNPGLGGTGTFGGVHSYWFGRRIGFSGKVMRWVEEMHEYLHHPAPKGIIPKWNIEAKSYALLAQARAAGVEVLLNAFVIGTLVEGNQVRGIAVATRTGVSVIRAKVVIDASGDGDVAAFAGADYLYGNARDHVVMWYALAQFPRPGLTRNHFTSMVDVSNIEDYTRAILAGRRRGTKETMHDHGIYVAPRESRHIQADLVLTLTDQLRGRRWADVINVAFSNHDVKGHTGSDWLRMGLIPPNLEVEIPYRALLPRGLENILVVGKAISATHDALPAIRMQADLENLGGVAALAAAQAIRERIPPRQIDVHPLQVRLVDEAVLPPRILDRTLRPVAYTAAELQALIDALPVMPLYEYGEMELTDLYEGVIPLVEICCAGDMSIPLLEAAHAEAAGDRKTLLAQMLALLGSTAGVPTLIDAIQPHLSGDSLPARTASIRYTQLPPDHGAMPEVVYLLYSLALTPDARALPIWGRVIDLLKHATEADFYDDLKGVFYYVDAVCAAAERAGVESFLPLLLQLHGCAPFHGKTDYDGFQPDFVLERIASLEVVIGRALARCGAVDGLIVLVSYLSDRRALLAEHAHSELAAITGEDFGKDVGAWSRWIEFNGDLLEPAPYREATEPVKAWSEAILTDRTSDTPVIIHTLDTPSE